MDRPLIGVTGFAQSGKDTLVRRLVAAYGYERAAFADRLKFEAACRLLQDKDGKVDPQRLADLLAYFEENKKKEIHEEGGWVRPFLQVYGQARRELEGSDYWIRQVEMRPQVAISDVRYVNEAVAIRAAGGQIWRVERPGVGPRNNHASETEQLQIEPDLTWHNKGAVDDLHAAIDRWMPALCCGMPANYVNITDYAKLEVAA